jgi:HSP20 family molecular chaperone IbpA
MFYEEKFNTMKTDIKETENGYVMDVEIPGFDKKDVNVSLKDGYLTITAEKTETDEDKKHNYIRRERSSSLSRSYYVGDVSNESVKAKYENGILSIEIPKEEPKKELTHNVEIQ